MFVYHYNELKKYSGQSKAYESPLEPGVFFIPANATDIQPPECPEGYELFFNNTTWELKLAEVGETGVSEEFENISFEEKKQKLLVIARRKFITFCEDNTDCYYIESLAEGISVPEEIVSLRLSKKNEYESYCSSVNLCENLEQLLAIGVLEL